MRTQVTKPAPVERFISRSGVLQPDMAEINRIAEAREPEHYREERKIDRTTLDDLEATIRTMEATVTDRQYSVNKLEPEVESAERRLERCREDVMTTTAAVAERVTGSRLDHKHALAALVDAQEVLALVKQRLEVSTRVLAATLAIQVEFFKVNGTRLAKLRKLTVRSRVGDKR